MLNIKIELLVQDHNDIREAVKELHRRIVRALRKGEDLPFEKSLYSDQGNVARVEVEEAGEDQSSAACYHAAEQIAQDLQLEFIKDYIEEES
jgi:hypothetical protein